MSNLEPGSIRTGKSFIALAGWVALCFCPSATAVLVSTGGWYAELNKPSWNPPSWLFGPVWSVLYLMMGVSAWRIWNRGGWEKQRGPLSLFVGQLACNALWTPLFFGMHWLGVAFVEIVALWLMILLTIRAFHPIDRKAAWMLAPYLCWVTFAVVLNGTIWRLN